MMSTQDGVFALSSTRRLRQQMHKALRCTGAPDAVVRVPVVQHVLERQLPLLLQLLQEFLPRRVRPSRWQHLCR